MRLAFAGLCFLTQTHITHKAKVYMDTTTTQIETDRLILRPFKINDAQRVYELLADGEIGKHIGYLPDPYNLDDAQTWLSSHEEQIKNKTGLPFAMTDKQTGDIIGSISLSSISKEHRHAELGYWLAKAYWNNGFTTEAARALLDYAFENYDLLRIHAHHIATNTASKRVLEKLGMIEEGLLRQHINHRGKQSDIIIRAILKHEW